MNLSHWHATLDRPALPDAGLPSRAEVVVVGGGVLGAFVAYWLARAGAAPVLVERGGLAAGATGHNGGLCVAGTAEGYPGAVARLGREEARAVWAMSLEGYAMLQQVVAEEEIACDLRPTGNIGLALDAAQLAAFEQAAGLLREDGLPPFELLTAAEAAEYIGTPLGPEVVGAKLNRHGATLHSTRLVYGLLAAAARRGARLCFGAAVTGLGSEGGVVRVTTGRGVIEAGAVVLAANAWSDELVPGLAGVITPVRGQAFATAAAAPGTLRCGFGAALTPTGEYGQQTPGGAVIFGGYRAAAPGRDVGVRDMAPSAEVQAALDGGLGRLFPRLAGVPIERRWAGLMAFTPDYLPIAGAAPGLPGVWFAGGFCGHGMPFAAPVGRLLAEAALGGAAPRALLPFRLDRATLG